MAAKKKTGGSAGSELDWREVERVLDLMKRHGLEEFEYSDGGFHVRLKKLSASPNAVSPAAVAAPSGGPAEAHRPAAPPPAASSEENLHIVKSPIVGTFYAAPSPTSPPFVKVGDHVKTGQVLCVIEAMKLMNEIEADATGEIARVLVENAQPVEYGEPLFAIRPSEPGRPA
ncbi:MAG TPA: acetyl-CoA carboxylase biotin carboxyl carrier protein [Candidatus Acidoferrales bacterium]|nr:acetyl-CoA carboxylase biotin carboxyl carrier protein [Candidatus Acidoferrales bacterium]